MKWTTDIPTEPGYYYVNQTLNPYDIIILELDEDDRDDNYDDNPTTLSWSDPNQDVGYDYDEFPSNTRYKGPLPHPN